MVVKHVHCILELKTHLEAFRRKILSVCQFDSEQMNGKRSAHRTIRTFSRVKVTKLRIQIGNYRKS